MLPVFKRLFLSFFSSGSSSREEKETCAFIKDIKSTAQPKSPSTCNFELKWVCEKRIEWAHRDRVQPTSTHTHTGVENGIFLITLHTFAHLLYCITVSLRKPFVFILKLHNLPSDGHCNQERWYWSCVRWPSSHSSLDESLCFFTVKLLGVSR